MADHIRSPSRFLSVQHIRDPLYSLVLPLDNSLSFYPTTSGQPLAILCLCVGSSFLSLSLSSTSPARHIRNYVLCNIVPFIPLRVSAWGYRHCTIDSKIVYQVAHKFSGTTGCYSHTQKESFDRTTVTLPHGFLGRLVATSQTIPVSLCRAAVTTN